MHHTIFSINFSTPEFAEAIRNVFINVGLAHELNSSPPTYVKYTSHDDKLRVRTNHLFKQLGPDYHVPVPPADKFSPGDLFEDFIVGRETLSRLGGDNDSDFEDLLEGGSFSGDSDLSGSRGAGGGGHGPQQGLLLNK